MPDDEKSLNIKITTSAELAGAKELESSLERNIGRAKALGQVEEVGKLTNQLRDVRAAISATAVEENALAGAGETLHENHRELHELFSKMGRESVPVLGEAMGSMLRGPVGPAIALVATIGYVKAAFEGWQKDLEDTGDIAANSEFGDSLKKVGEDMDAAREKAENYALAIADIAKHEISIASALQSQLALIQAVAAARAEAAKAAEDLAAAENQRKADAGEITPEQAAINEAGAAIKTAKDEAAARKKQSDDELVAKQAALDKASLAQAGLDKAAKESAEAAEEQRRHRDRLAGNFGPEGKIDVTSVTPNSNFQIPGTENVKTEKDVPIADAIRKAQEQLDQWIEKVEKLEKTATAPAQSTEEKAYNEDQLSKARAYEDQARGQVQNFERGRNQYNRAFSPDANQAFTDAQHTANTAADKGQKNADEIDKLRSELDDLRKQLTQTQPINDSALADRIATILEQAVDKLYSMPRGSEIETGIKIADQRLRGNNPQDSQQQAAGQLDEAGKYLMELATQLGLHVKTVKEAAEAIEVYKDNTAAFFEAVIKLTSQGFTAQQHQFDQLAAQVARIRNNSNNP